MKRAVLGLLLLLALTAALIGWLFALQQSDSSYAPQLARRTWPTGGPTVAIDDAHWNMFTAVKGYAPFAKLLLADGYTVLDKGNVASPEVLEAATIVVIANALGFRGVIRQVGELAGVRLDAIAADAFTDQEADRLEAWVRNGGSLLLIADHAPAGRAARSLAERFGVKMRDGYIFDPERSELWSPTFLVFTRHYKMLGLHPIIDGKDAGDAIDRIVTFTGQALEGPAHATQLLTLSQTAFESSGRTASLEDRKPVGGLAQALAFAHGRGRVVVVGEATVLTSQMLTEAGTTQRMGLQWAKSDNERFARNVMRWLSKAGE